MMGPLLRSYVPAASEAGDRHDEKYQKKIEEYLTTFDLNDFGKNGISLSIDEEPEVVATQEAANQGGGGVFRGNYQHPIHMK